MATTETTFFKYKYSIESFDVLFPNDKTPVSIPVKQIQSLFIERDFDNDFFPVIRLDATFDTSVRYRIIAEKTEVKFRLKMRKYRMRREEIVKTTDVMNLTFGIFLDEDTPHISKELLQKTNDVTGKQPSEVGSSAMSLYLYKDKDLIQTKKIINTIFTASNMTNVLAYLLSSNGFNKVLMTPLDNKASFKEIIVPPATFIATLKYLESQYGLYNSGSTIFFDLDLVYILKKGMKSSAWKSGEYVKTVLNVSRPSSENAIMTGVHHDDKKKSYLVHVAPEAIQFKSPSVLHDQFEGNHRLIINPSIDKTFNVKSNATQRGEGTYKVVVNPYGNTFMNTSEQYALTSNSTIVSIEVQDIDIDIFSPNKEFTIQFDDKTIQKTNGGNYRLSKVVQIFQGAGSSLSVTTRAIFKK